MALFAFGATTKNNIKEFFVETKIRSLKSIYHHELCDHIRRFKKILDDKVAQIFGYILGTFKR